MFGTYTFYYLTMALKVLWILLLGFCLVVVDGRLLSYINYLGVVLFAELCFLELVWVGFWLCSLPQAALSQT
jgi:hypothetical protein